MEVGVGGQGALVWFEAGVGKAKAELSCPPLL